MTAVFYDLVFLAFAFLSLPIFLVRLKQASNPARLLAERRGFFSPDWLGRLDGRPVIWAHAVSVGEVLGIEPFLRKAAGRFPQFQFVLSVTTPTGFRMAEKMDRDGIPVFYAPFDLSGTTRRVLELLKPRALLLMETELWPNLLRSSGQFGVKVALINGRLSPRSFKGYRWLRPFLKRLLGSFVFLGVQSVGDRDRFRALGADTANIHVLGSLKYDKFDTDSAVDPASIRAPLFIPGGHLVFLAGSTHAGEEELLLDVFRELRKKFPSLVLILAPRHAERAGRILERACEMGFEASRYSNPVPESAVMVVDVMGKLRDLYAAADLVFMGGSLVKHGGQNPVEAIRFRKPVISGPFVFNFQSLFDLLLREGGVRMVRNREELSHEAERLLGDRHARECMGTCASGALEALAGSVTRHLDLFEKYVAVGVSSPPIGRASTARTGAINRTPTLRQKYIRFIHEEGGGKSSSLFARLLQVASVIYRAVVVSTEKLYRTGVLEKKKLPVPVVSVGNITWGGTGKTPLVDYVARYYAEKDLQVLILTRGYGRDEAEELRANQPGVRLAVGKNRYREGMDELLYKPVHVAVLDDGFQHWKLRRALDVITVNALNPFGNERLIPAGMLREPVSAIRRADLIVITHTHLAGPDALSALRVRLASYGHDEPSIVEAVHEPQYFYRASTGERISPDTLSAKPAVAFSGIGYPGAFEQTLEHAGVRLERVVRFDDHHRYSAGELRKIRDARSISSEVITTEKDFVRSPELIKDELDPLVLKVKLRIVKGEELFHAHLDRVLGR